MESSLIETSTATTAEKVQITPISTRRYLSLDINVLFPLVTDDPTNVEDVTYVQRAIKSIVTSKDLSQQKDYLGSVQYANKAVGLIEKLFEMRKEKNPDFVVLQAPFYYFLANQILTYAENSIDVFGNIIALPDDVLPLFSEDEDQESEDDNPEAPNVDVETVNQQAQQNDNDEDEPRIEEEVKSQVLQKDEESKEELKEQDKGNDEMHEICIDIQENLAACIELVLGFLNTENQLEASKLQREEALTDLLIDAYYKLGELCFFQELYEPAIPYYGRVTELCTKNGKTKPENTRILASAFFQIGSAYQNLQKRAEAEYNYTKGAEVFKFIIIYESKQVGKEIDPEAVTFEQLVQPSIFDNEGLKDLKEQL